MQWILTVPDDLADGHFKRALDSFLASWLSDGFFSLMPLEEVEREPLLSELES